MKPHTVTPRRAGTTVLDKDGKEQKRVEPTQPTDAKPVKPQAKQEPKQEDNGRVTT